MTTVTWLPTRVNVKAPVTAPPALPRLPAPEPSAQVSPPLPVRPVELPCALTENDPLNGDAGFSHVIVVELKSKLSSTPAVRPGPPCTVTWPTTAQATVSAGEPALAATALSDVPPMSAMLATAARLAAIFFLLIMQFPPVRVGGLVGYSRAVVLSPRRAVCAGWLPPAGARTTNP